MLTHFYFLVIYPKSNCHETLNALRISKFDQILWYHPALESTILALALNRERLKYSANILVLVNSDDLYNTRKRCLTSRYCAVVGVKWDCRYLAKTSVFQPIKRSETCLTDHISRNPLKESCHIDPGTANPAEWCEAVYMGIPDFWGRESLVLGREWGRSVHVIEDPCSLLSGGCRGPIR